MIWPYSSSKDSISILLVEPDIRLRRNKGQVRIAFTGASARAVAKSEVTTGDDLVLGLLGASWSRIEEGIQISGECVPWQLLYGPRLVLKV